MIRLKDVEQQIRLAEGELQRILVRMHNDRDYWHTTNDTKRVAITLYEFLCKFQGQEEGR
jgi:hypothetical protein